MSIGQLLTGVSFGTYQCKATNRFGESIGVTNVYSKWYFSFIDQEFLQGL